MSDESIFIGDAPRGPVLLSREASRRHAYVIGKSGSGKTTLLANMAVQNLRAGDGVCVIDPHGDFSASLLDHIPAARTRSTVYFNPADLAHCVGLNLLAEVPPDARATAAAGVIAAFSHIFGLAPESTPRLLHYLRNSLLALLDAPGMTLVHLPLLLTDPLFRTRVVRHVINPMVSYFWNVEFPNNPDRYNREAMGPVLNKIESFLVYPAVCNIVGQRQSTINLRRLMDEGGILIANLAKGQIGEEASNLLGSLLVTQLQIAAMSRADIPEASRRDFLVYVDEFQNFTTSSFAGLLSEARKMRVSLCAAHQYRSQVPEAIADAVVGNAGTMVVFRVGAQDGEYFAKEMAPVRLDEITDLPPFAAWVKTVDRSSPTHVVCRPYPKPDRPRAAKIINASRERVLVVAWRRPACLCSTVRGLASLRLEHVPLPCSVSFLERQTNMRRRMTSG